VRTGLTGADGARSLVEVVGADKRLRSIDPRSGETLAEDPNQPLASFPVEEDVADPMVVGEFVVFANHPDARLNVLDPRTGRIVHVIPVAGNPTGLTWDGERLWYCDYATSRLGSVVLRSAGVAVPT
jgi:hypothetical protein